MAQVTVLGDVEYVVSVDATEADTVRLHAVRNELSPAGSMADIVERGFLDVQDEIVKEEQEARGEHCVIPDMVGFTINWAKSGPYAAFGDKEIRFIESVMAMSLREALTVCLYKMSQKGIDNVVEREDKGMGTGEPPVS